LKWERDAAKATLILEDCPGAQLKDQLKGRSNSVFVESKTRAKEIFFGANFGISPNEDTKTQRQNEI